MILHTIFWPILFVICHYPFGDSIMGYDLRSPLSCYIHKSIARGKTVFTDQEATEALGIGRGAFLDAAERLKKRGLLFTPRRGFYLPVPQEYIAFGAPPPSYYIDALMRFEDTPYYVALLKAGEYHGGTHQAVMEFQVMTKKRIPILYIGRSRIKFFHRSDIECVQSGIEKRRTYTGYMKLASAALTALDMLRYPRGCAELDNVVTVLSDIATNIKSRQLASLSSQFELPIVQCLGFLLDKLGFEKKTRLLYKATGKRGLLRWTDLNRHEYSRDANFLAPILVRDDKWRVSVRRIPEVD